MFNLFLIHDVFLLLLILCNKVETAMKRMHACGVVHLDWYLSNFMWTTTKAHEEEDIVLRIIDFDSAHLVDDNLSPMTSSRLLGIRTILAEREQGGILHKENFDISLMKLLKKYENDEILQSTEKHILDGHFRYLQELEQ